MKRHPVHLLSAKICVTLPQNLCWIGDCPSRSAAALAAAAAADTPSQLRRSPSAWAWLQNLPASGGN